MTINYKRPRMAGVIAFLFVYSGLYWLIAGWERPAGFEQITPVGSSLLYTLLPVLVVGPALVAGWIANGVAFYLGALLSRPKAGYVSSSSWRSGSSSRPTSGVLKVPAGTRRRCQSVGGIQTRCCGAAGQSSTPCPIPTQRHVTSNGRRTVGSSVHTSPTTIRTRRARSTKRRCMGTTQRRLDVPRLQPVSRLSRLSGRPPERLAEERRPAAVRSTARPDAALAEALRCCELRTPSPRRCSRRSKRTSRRRRDRRTAASRPCLLPRADRRLI